MELLARIDGPICRINNQLDHLQDHLDRRGSDTPQIRRFIDAAQIQTESKSYVGCRLNLISIITNRSKSKPLRVRASGYCRIHFISNGEVTVFLLSCGSMVCQALARAPSCRLRKTRRSGIRFSFRSLDQHIPYAGSNGCTLFGKSVMRPFVVVPFNLQCRPMIIVLKGAIRLDCLPLLRWSVTG